MTEFCKPQIFQKFSTFFLIAGALLSLALDPLSPRNALRADDNSQPASYTVAQLDSLFRTVYSQDENPYSGSGWKAYHRFSWFYGQRAYPTGDIPATARMQAWEERQQNRHDNLDENWTPIGPTNLAGRILCLAWHPTNANTIFAGSASGGLWKTVDGGVSWSALTDQLPSLAVGAVALQPGNPNVIYIGTGEGAFNADAVYGAGIFKSTDGGTTWNATGLSWTQSQGRAINKIVINPANTQILYAAASRAIGGVFKSTNGGTSWTQYHAGDVKDLILHPDSANVLYCVAGDPWGNAQNGVFRSTDSGITWTRQSNGLPSASSMGRAQMVMAASNRQTLYVGISQTLSAGAGLLGVYKTTDAGATWTLQADTPNFYAGQGWYNLVIAVHPTDAAIVYSSGVDCYKSTDSGVNWTRKSFWSYPPNHSQYAHADHHDLIFKPGDPNTILAATDGGVYKSVNGGDTWSGVNNGLNTYQFYAMGNDALNSSVAYGGTQDNGTNKYTGSNSWTWVMSGDGGYCNVDYTNSNIVYAETQRGSHYKSTNGGTSWTYIQTGITGYGEWVTPVAMDPTNPSVLYTATTQIYRSSNGGANWSSVSPDFSTYYVSTIAVAPSNTSVIYAGCSGLGDVWKTTDGGSNWTNVSTGLPDRYVTRVAVHPTSATTVYAAMSGYGSGHVWKSTNGGTTWTNSSTGLPDIPCNTLVIDQNSPSTLYAGTDLGVYYSSDGGTTWSDYSTSLPNVVVDDLALHPTTGALRAATHGRGMWETATGGAPSIVVLTPNGGDSWPIGTSQSVTWGTGGLGGNVRIELNRNYPGGGWEILTSSSPNDGSYTWTVAGANSTAARIRVTSVEFPSATDVSNENFSITGPVITLVHPVGGDTLVVGSVDTISWNISGTPGTVVVQLNRTYPSVSWTTLATTSNLSTPFTVSGPVTNTARVRVYLQSDPTRGDTSAANFSIVQPAITVTWPNGGESLTPGQSVMLRWTSAYVTGTKCVEINRNYPSGTWDTLGAVVVVDSMPWTVDELGSSTARIRVTSNLFSAATDVSNGNFTILTPIVAVVTPNGGEAWGIGETHTIRWVRSNLSGLVNVYLNTSYPSGPWVPVQLNVSADSVQWVVPPPASGAARMRVASVNLPSFFGESNADFLIGTGITVTSPNGGENWSLTGLATIAWTRANANGNATVQLNRTYPVGAWETLTTTAGGNSHVWVISGQTTTAARVRVFLTNDIFVGDTSDASFNIVSSALNLITPNGGEIWNTRTTHTIQWSRTNAPGPVSVLLNREYPSGTWDTLATAVSVDTFSWLIPNDGCSTSVARVRIVWEDVPQITDQSAGNFSIVPKLKLLTPIGGEVWELSSTQMIRWQRSNSPGPVRILLTRTWPELTWITLTATAMGDSFQYILPDYGLSDVAHVAIYMTDDFSISDTSDAGFSIVPSTALQLISPNGGEVWPLNSTQVIRWQRDNMPGPVRILLTRTWPELNWVTLTATAMADTFVYNVPGSGTSDVAHVAIYMTDHFSITDTSEAGFWIVPSTSITVTSPIGGDTWYIGEQRWIRWTRHNYDGEVNVDIQRMDRSQPWQRIAESMSDSILWTVTGPASDFAMLRLMAADDPDIFDTTDAPFRIAVPHVTVVAPNGGEELEPGSEIHLRWIGEGFDGGVSVRLWRGWPANQLDTLFVETVNDSDEIWTVGGPAAASCYLIVRSVENPALWDTSDTRFIILDGTAASEGFEELPQEFSLEAPYPNPFNSNTIIRFALSKSGNVSLAIFDVLGRELVTLMDEHRAAGYYTISWNATAAASGTYFVRMSSGDFVRTRKLHLVK